MFISTGFRVGGLKVKEYYIDPYYKIFINEKDIKIINIESNIDKYRLKIKSEYLPYKECVEAIGKCPENSIEYKVLKLLYDRLKDIIIINKEEYLIRKNIYNYLLSIKKEISPRERFKIYNTIIEFINGKKIFLIISDRYKNIDFVKVMSGKAKLILENEIDNQILDEFGEDDWIIYIGENNNEVLKKVNEKIKKKDNTIIIFINNVEKGYIQLGPMLIPKRHGCLECAIQTQEQQEDVVSKKLKKIITNKKYNFISQSIQEEFFNILIDHYYKYNSSFSNIICKQYSINLNKMKITYKEIRKISKCNFCY